MSIFKRARRAFSPQKETDFTANAPRPNKDAISTSLPQAQAPTVNVTTPTPAVIATANTDHQTTDSSIQAAAGKADTNTPSAITGIVPSTTVNQNQSSTATASTSAPAITDDYQLYWHRELDYQLEELVLDETNYWTPNSLALMTALTIIGNFLSTNTHIRKYFPNYCHPATIIYYSVIFYVQILRARKAADKLTGVERKFLRRFEGKFAFESLPISGPIFAILSTLISTMIGDGKYDWNVPQIAPDMFTRAKAMNDFLPTNGSVYLQPQVPYMVGILRLFIMDSFRTAVIANETHYVTDDDQMTAFIPSPTLHPLLFGMDLHRNTATNADHVLLPSASGIDILPFIGLDQLTRSGPTWNRSKFNQIDFVAYRPNNTTTRSDLKATNVNGTKLIDNLANFLCMPEEENMEWFEFCLEQAITQAKFTKGKYNLSQVPTVGGNETLILANLKHRETTNAAEKLYPDARLEVDETNFNWYPQHFERMTASFATDRANYKRSEELQALAFAPNATLPITIGAARTGSTPSHRKGSYYHADTRERIRAGHRIDVGQNIGKPMFSRWTDLYLQSFMIVKPDVN